MKFAYVKNGDAVDQVSRLMPRLDDAPSSGPDAFIADFLCSYSGMPLLLLSRGSANRLYREGNVEARMFNRNGRNILGPLMMTWASFRIFLHLLRFRPDRILCGTRGGALWASYLASRILSVPLVHSRHNRISGDDGGVIKRLFAGIDNWVIRRAKSVICHGPFLYHQIVDIGVPEEQVFEFDVRFDASVYNSSVQLPDIQGLQKLDRLLVYVGRIEANKGVFDLLHACQEYLEQSDTLKLIYIGNGAAQDSLRAEVRSTGLTDKVFLLGRMDHDALLAVIRRSLVLVSPTQSCFPEGRCMAAMEGLVMGVPVIAPDFGPFPYLVRHGENGLLFEADSVQNLKQAIESLLVDDDQLEKLKTGASESGRQLREPALTFARAVTMAFDMSPSERERYASKV